MAMVLGETIALKQRCLLCLIVGLMASLTFPYLMGVKKKLFQVTSGLNDGLVLLSRGV